MNQASGPGNRLRALLPSLVLNGAVPLLVYVLSRPYLSGDAVALALAMAVPVVCTIVMFGWRRRLDAIGVIAVAAYGVALIAVLLSGGNPFVLKLQEAVVTGPLGLTFLISVAVNRPLLPLLARLAKRRGRPSEGEQSDPARRRAGSVLTAIMGTTFVAHAVVLTALALMLSTAEVLVVSRVAGLSILGLGLIIVVWCRSRLAHTAQRH